MSSSLAPAAKRILPPRPPKGRDGDDYRSGLRISMIVHAVLLATIIFKSIVFPGKPIAYVPTLRVDIVGLPDILKKDLAQIPPSGGSLDQIKQALDQADVRIKQAKAKMPKPSEIKAAETAQKDEMVIKPKAPPQKTDAKARDKRLKGALARIKALEKIAVSEQSTPPAPGVLIKGNRVSRGTSLSGDARESSEANYYDNLRSRLQQNWALPVWLSRQNLSAQVRIQIDGRGRLRNFRFLKLSGNNQFDAAVKQCLTESQPFPLPPETLASSMLVDGILIGFPL